MKYNLKGLYIEITSKCNLKCKHCYNNSGESIVDISVSSLENLVIDAIGEGVRNFTISGGEPFTRTDIVEIIKIILKNSSTTLTIVTNAMLITNALLLEIKNCVNNIERIHFQISVDGFDEKSHDFLRGSGSFKILSSKLNIFKELGFKTSFHVVLHSGNYNNVERIIEYAKNYNVKKVEFTFLKKKGRTDLFYNQLLIKPQEERLLIKKFKQLTIDEKQVSFTHPQIFYGKCPLFEDDSSDMFARIDVYGNLYPCQNFDNKESIIGNINQNKLKDIITETNMKKLYDRILKKRMHDGLCNKCYVKNFCGKGCLGVEFCDDYNKNYSNDCLLRRECFFEELNNLGTKLLKVKE